MTKENQAENASLRLLSNWRSSAILALQIAGELNVRDALVADALDSGQSGGSPLVELVTSGTLDSEALAQALAQSSGRPRLRWNMLSNQGLERVYQRFHALCSRYQCIPLRLVEGDYVAIAMVDPTWSTASQALKEYFGVPVREFVISHDDYLYVTCPELCPSSEDFYDFGETVEESIPTETLELLRSLGAGLGVDRRDIDIPDATNVMPESGDFEEDTASRQRDAEAIEAVKRLANELGLEWTDGGEGGRIPQPTPEAPLRALIDSQAFAKEVYSLQEAIPALSGLTDRILQAEPLSDTTWSDLFDVFSLIGCACVRGLRFEKEMFLSDLWVGGTPVSVREWALIGQMLHRVFPSEDSTLHVLQLDPRHREEVNITGFIGTNVMMCTAPTSDGCVAFFALIGLPGESIREMGPFMSRFSRRKSLATLMNGLNRPGTRLIQVA